MKEHEKKAYLIAQGCNAVDKYGVPEPETLAAMQSYSDQQSAALRERVKELEALMQEFVDRVDRGEVRSKRTYAKFKEALKK